MRFPLFVEAVSRRSGIPPEQAAVVTRAVLQTMVERMTGGDATDLAGHLPDDLGGYLAPPAPPPGIRSPASPPVTPAPAPPPGIRSPAPRPVTPPAGPADFLRRVGQRAGVDDRTARAGAGAVFATLRDAVTVAEFRDMVARLPRDFDGMVDPVPRPDEP
ncbi:Uncharacterized conserved protein, DUF2267 family [Micromonospora nigra]|uniref:Uncharacterized conserved protein, DUF2267 family n=1 Tax=Micromonospora nigra TaxID=145857 RepID=A0A1C6SYE5_9ACTN|nr:DUF2267 domain-containing protein [Micromonospora nigra]SCL34586.1 Uncharacterized conserved protein, DUF2267 family [Micromonospora nigra]